MWNCTKSFVSWIHTCLIVHLEWPFKMTTRVSFIYFGSLKNRGPKMASHGLIQWTCIAIVTSKVNAIFKSSTWGIDGNVRKKQVYLLSSIIFVKSFMRSILLSSTKLSMQMCQLASNGCTFSIYGNQAWSMWFLSHTWNIFWDIGLNLGLPIKTLQIYRSFPSRKAPTMIQ